MSPSIHVSSALVLHSGGLLEPVPAVFGTIAGFHPSGLPALHTEKGHTERQTTGHTLTYRQFRVRLLFMSLDSGRSNRVWSPETAGFQLLIHYDLVLTVCCVCV